ncbi:uncharacterized protein MELLADRAFT_105737 [Melampsora larici-populina 98AG31]|uniref:Secreted protein n=1 Tax=Melampsora larici-populina (strain 98AG31 / pathotype 3-4-7) TaxID=747676 RepID=F4RID2_MELLP|nr:uncharacterized protein MELLADRAFT_105737 [Melampsora larici-populina 98AG31]EGG07700.1 hypothetical protein MELLADRAFT_105737 [Melampsora larici-populina 98AG31]
MKLFVFCPFILLKFSSTIICPYTPQYRLDSVPRRYPKEFEVQLYQPFHIKPDATLSSNLESISLISTENSPPVPDINRFKRLLNVKKKIPTWWFLDMDLDELASNLRISFPFLQEKIRSDAFMKGKQVEKTINYAVDILENYRLQSKERIWVLAVLTHLQEYLPKGDLRPIVTDMSKGPISNAGLQLHLTKGLNLIGASQELWNSKKGPTLLEIDLSLSEALSKWKIIKWLTCQFRADEASKSSKFMVETHDLLLQESCPMEEETLRKLLLRCSQNLEEQDTSPWDKELAYIILHKYEQIYPVVRDFVRFQKSQNDYFKKTYEYKELPNLILQARQDLGPFKNLMKLFLKEKSMNMDSIKLLIDSILRTKQKYQRWEDTESKQMANQEDSVIRLLQHISTHIDGAKSYLEDLVDHRSDSQMYTFNTLELSPTGQPCVICQQDMHKEEALVKLHSEVDHQLHMDCWQVYGEDQEMSGRLCYMVGIWTKVG